MRMKKFEYFLNAVHYCMWLREKKVYRFGRKACDRLFSPLQYLFTEKFRKRYHERRQKTDPQWDNSYLNSKDGFCVDWAHHWLGYFSACYPGFISFLLLGLGTRWFGRLPSLVVIAFIAIPVGSFYIPFYKALYTKDRYLKYFKKFEKEDEHWHKKWSRITTLFCVGAALMFVGGIVAMIVIDQYKP